MSMLLSPLDESIDAYVNGQLSDLEARDLSRRLSTGDWMRAQEARRRRLMKPRTDELKSRWPNGTILYLKGGSPKLLVDWCRDDGVVSVCWFDVDLHLCRDAFPPELLQTEAV